MLAYVFVLFAILARLTGVTWGFSPLGASLLFFGAHRSRKQLFFVLPALIVTDVVLNRRYGFSIQPDQWVIWAWYAGAILFGSLLKDRIKPLYVIGAALTSELSFFLITNFMVWFAWNSYPKTWQGLGACYVAGIPFFKNGLASNLLFSTIFFSIPVLAAKFSGVMARRHETV